MIQYVVGDQRKIVNVSQLIGDEDFSSSEYNNSHICCVYGNCTCNSLDHALANLTSNVLINITTDVTLSLLIERSALYNVSIIGHNNPIVNCKNASGIHFKFCHNCIIQGISWNKCGSATKAGLMLNDYSNIAIQNCSFQHSLGQVIALSEVSGNVNINNCNFVNNTQYTDHGTAIHYYSNDSTSNLVFYINNCNFSHNKHAKSLVYAENRIQYSNLTLCNATFQDNEGVSIYLVNQKIYLNGKVLFLHNNAGSGTGINIINHSTVIFGENSDVTFIHNFADFIGGAILSRNHSNVFFNYNSKVSFSNNTAYVGGAVYSNNNCNIFVEGNSNVVLSNNTGEYGGAVYLRRFSTIWFEENSTTIFNNNTASKYGGAIRAYDNSNIGFEGNSNTVFSNNTASNYGGAICTYNSSNVSSEGNAIIQFSYNIANFGGAVCLEWFSNGCFEGNSTIVFNYNAASHYGGAIYTFHYGSNICFKGNSTAVFNSNVASYYGGAICTYNNNVSFGGNSTTRFNNNAALHRGGAIFTYNSNISFEVNSTTMFISNNASHFGGAICTYKSNVSFEGNSTTMFNNNAALYRGGAIFTFNNYNISFEGYSIIMFNNNTALYYGGAISINHNSNISFEGNSFTQFTSNTAKYGGVMNSYYNSFTSFKGNSTTVFGNNIALSYGAVMHTQMNSDITFDGSSKINFANDKTTNGKTVNCSQNSKVIAKGHSSVIFNSVSVKWCNNICPPDFNNNVVTIDSHGIVRCSYQGGFTCQMKKCNCSEFERDLNSDSLIIVKGAVTLSSVVSFTNLTNISIVGHNNPFVYCVNGGGLNITNSSNIVLEGITWIGCGNNIKDDDNKDLHDFTELSLKILDSPTRSEQLVPVIHLQFSINVKVQNCVFQYSEGRAVEMSELLGEVNISQCDFLSNIHYRGHGAAIHYTSYHATSSSQCLLVVNSCSFAHNNFSKSLVYIENRMSERNENITIYDSKFYHNQGVSIHVANQKVYLTGKTVFSNNIATNGSGIYITNHSTVMFGKHSEVVFTENIADYKGSAIYLQSYSTIVFDQNSKVTFHDNEATSGTVYSETNSNVIFKGTCHVTFSSNSVEQHGAAIHSFDNSSITFTGNATVHFKNNYNASKILHGGTIFLEDNSNICFDENSATEFSNNTANFGAAIFLHQKSNLNFKSRSRVTFNNNTAINGGAVALYDNCTATIEQFSNITFSNNNATQCGGALYFLHNSNILFTDNSVSVFANNMAERYGGAICFNVSSNITFEENSAAFFIDNAASFGENLYSNGSSYTDIKNINLITNNNTVKRHYIGQFTNNNDIINDIIIDANGIVSCNDHKAYYICQHNKCYCENIEDIPSNVAVIITKNITLTSTIKLTNIINVSLIGYNDSSIHYESDGGLQFISCSIITVKNLTWRKIIKHEWNINNTISQIKFYNSSNITIDHCTFQQSVGRAVVLSEVSGDVNIKHCKFVNNKYSLREHGAAIHYSSNCAEISKVKLIINDCHFTDNFGIASLIYFEQHSNNNPSESIILQNSKFDNNQGVCVYLSNQNLNIKGNVLFESNEAENGAGIFINDHSNAIFAEASNVTFVQNTATINGGAIYVNNWSSVVFENNAHVVFTSNKATRSGGAIYSYSNSRIMLKENSKAYFIYSNADFGGTLYAENNSFVLTTNQSKLTISNSKATYGGAIYIKQNSNMTNTENSTTEFINNEAIQGGGCIYSDSNSRIILNGNSTTEFFNNAARKGGGIYSYNKSDIEFDENSKVWFNRSTATELGGIFYIKTHSYVTTKGTSILTICNSEATNGGASYLMHNSGMVITENSTVTFLNSEAKADGGGIYSHSNSSIIFSENSVTNINKNRAARGGAIYSYNNCNIILDQKSQVWFNHSTAELGRTLYTEKESYIITKGISNLIICNSEATDGGASYLIHSSSMTTTEDSTATFLNNEALEDGGGIHSKFNSTIMFTGDSIVTITSNNATRGGAVFSIRASNIYFHNNSNIIFNKNEATQNGGCIYTHQSTIQFKGTCRITFSNSVVFNGAGGAISCTNSIAIFEGTSNVEFHSNKATDGGAADFNVNSSLIIRNKSDVAFINNSAIMGGAVHFHVNSNGTFEMKSTLVLRRNSAFQDGGTFYLARHCYIEFKEFVNAKFDNNDAERGGAIFLMASTTIVKNCSTIMFKNNTASQDGGAIYIADQSQLIFIGGANVTFSHNRASDYGGAIFSKMVNSKITFGNSTMATFLNNSAGTTGSSVYISLPRQCNSTCLNGSILDMDTIDTHSYIITSPNKIQLYNSKIQCIDVVNDTKCNLYYRKNIMLGQKILLDACTYDYYGHPVDVAQFLITGINNQGYHLYSSNTLMTCNDTVELASIYGNESTPFNYSINISLYDNRQSESKQVLTKLLVELSPCHPGFLFYNKSQKCECYNSRNDIVFCSGSSSTIKRGYWFGNVTGKPTITFCPINYCNFTCCQTSNEYYHLSPVRDNQCRSHRSGTACGNCENDYTLPFYSTECINEDNCTVLETVIVIILTVVYWIALVIAVFITMYYKVSVGYLYVITYYYSMVDVLLSEYLYIPNGLYITINIMYSIFKLTPQFLGKLCLVRGLSGIDQQFIHYVHPLAVSLILVMIVKLARFSHRLSVFISRGIIRVICFLLLLSYTSVTVTSLLLVKYLKFSDVDKIYTYLSPDIEYFQGRHLIYGIIAALCIIFIVIGVPLILIFEPFLNHKINFIRIKPLLDQFRGCYTNKYRWFAGYYMICRIIVISITVIFSSDGFISHYLLVIACGIIALIQLYVRPYTSKLLNAFDGLVLLLLVLVAILLFADFTNSDSFVPITFVLLILPLTVFAVMCLFIHKDALKKSIAHLKLFRSKINIKSNHTASSTSEYILMIDDRMRENATICDV